MALLEELHPGSFRGASFLVKSATTTGGRKQAKHEYPNSDKQSIEDLGFKPRSFKLSAIIHGRINADGVSDYLFRRDSLLTALEQGGIGTLSHPFFSNNLEVVARNWTLTENMADLGSASIDMEFDFSDRFTNPQPAPTSLAEITKQREAVQAAINANIAGTFRASTPQNFVSAQSLMAAFSEKVGSVTGTFNKIQSEVNAFSAELNSFTSDIVRLIQNPQNLADSMMSLMNTSAGLYQTNEAAIQVFARMFNFGDDIQSPEPTTVQRAERRNNDKVISLGTQASYLSLTYQFVSEIDFETVTQIDDVQQLMESQYEKLVNNGLNEDVADSLNTLRTLTNLWLETERLTASQVVTVSIKRAPLSVVAYQYYGDIDGFDELLDTLVELNRPASNNLSFMEKSVEVITV